MIYVYAIAEPIQVGTPLPRGLGNLPLLELERGGVAAMYSRTVDETLPPTAENVWGHEAVIEELMRTRTILPVRFGSTFPRLTKLKEALDAHAGKLAAGLEEVRGHVELGLRAMWIAQRSGPEEKGSENEGPENEGPAASPPSGREYLLARLGEERRRIARRDRLRSAADTLHAPLGALARRSVRRFSLDPAPLFTAAYLVAPEKIEPFRRRVQTLAERRPELRLLCTGPWPPYHFTPALDLEPDADSRKRPRLFEGLAPGPQARRA